jgi:hypothetical protein
MATITILISRTKRENLFHPPVFPAASPMMGFALHSRITHLTVTRLVQQSRRKNLGESHRLSWYDIGD